jgi:zinc D-Ala-D-Ala carboxypeptidase
MSDVPRWVREGGWVSGWERPWTVPRDPDKWPKFKDALWRHGLISPNFSRAEFASRADSCGCRRRDAPRVAQKLAFALEDARHDMGDKTIGVLSGFRSPCHNRCVGGATQSRHMVGDAIDPTKSSGVTQSKFNSVLRRVFENGGIGSGAVSGNVMHVDLGDRRRWTYPGA